MAKPEDWLIGAHTSAAGGAHNALYLGHEIGCTVIQLFTSNQRQWKGKKITDADAKLWLEALEKTGIREVMSHDSYLINLGSPKAEGLARSRAAFAEEVVRCEKLKIPYLNFHPGAALDDTEEACLKRIAESLLEVSGLLNHTTLILETTAGQGTNVGYRFEHLAAIIEMVKGKLPIGVCIDTCHIFAAGYDIRTKKSWDATLKEFDRVVGLKYLKAFHVNDSLRELGSRVDRHASIDEGQIGLEAFRVLMTHPKTRKLPKYLETPLGPKKWVDEIQLLRRLGQQANV